MRVLHCIPSMLGGGAERQLCYLSAGLVSSGHEVHVALMREGPNAPRLRATGATVHVLPQRRSIDVGVLTDLCSLIHRTRPAVVQTWLARMDMWGGLAAIAMGRPWIYSERTIWPQRETWIDEIRRHIIGRASAVVSNSETSASFWRGVLRHRVPVRAIPNALPMSEITSALPSVRASLGVPEDIELLLYVGRYIPYKNIGLLGDILVRVLRQRPRAWAVCCGEGAMADMLEGVLRDGGVANRCRMMGYRTDVWSIMKCADVTLSTSDREGRPNALLEAMACGCPIVASDIPQHREILGRDAGLFFPTGSAAEGVACVIAVLDDPAAAAVRAERAQASIDQTTSVSSVAEAYAQVYASLVCHD